MSNHSPLSNDSVAPSSPETEHRHDPWRQVARSLRGPAQFLGFWFAIALPFLHVPLLVRGLDSPSTTLTFLGLLTANVLALYVGHGYNQS